MRFTFTEDQLAFRDSFKSFLAEACVPSVVRAAWEQRPSELWGQLAELGLLALELPEETRPIEGGAIRDVNREGLRGTIALRMRREDLYCARRLMFADFRGFVWIQDVADRP